MTTSHQSINYGPLPPGQYQVAKHLLGPFLQKVHPSLLRLKGVVVLTNATIGSAGRAICAAHFDPNVNDVDIKISLARRVPNFRHNRDQNNDIDGALAKEINCFVLELLGLPVKEIHQDAPFIGARFTLDGIKYDVTFYLKRQNWVDSYANSTCTLDGHIVFFRRTQNGKYIYHTTQTEEVGEYSTPDNSMQLWRDGFFMASEKHVSRVKAGILFYLRYHLQGYRYAGDFEKLMNQSVRTLFTHFERNPSQFTDKTGRFIANHFNDEFSINQLLYNLIEEIKKYHLSGFDLRNQAKSFLFSIQKCVNDIPLSDMTKLSLFSELTKAIKEIDAMVKEEEEEGPQEEEPEAGAELVALEQEQAEQQKAEALARAEAQQKAEEQGKAESQDKLEEQQKAEALARAEAQQKADAVAALEAKRNLRKQRKAEAKVKAQQEEEAQLKVAMQQKAEGQVKSEERRRAKEQRKLEKQQKVEGQEKARAAQKADEKLKQAQVPKVVQEAEGKVEPPPTAKKEKEKKPLPPIDEEIAIEKDPRKEALIEIEEWNRIADAHINQSQWVDALKPLHLIRQNLKRISSVDASRYKKMVETKMLEISKGFSFFLTHSHQTAPDSRVLIDHYEAYQQAKGYELDPQVYQLLISAYAIEGDAARSVLNLLKTLHLSQQNSHLEKIFEESHAIARALDIFNGVLHDSIRSKEIRAFVNRISLELAALQHKKGKYPVEKAIQELERLIEQHPYDPEPFGQETLVLLSLVFVDAYPKLAYNQAEKAVSLNVEDNSFYVFCKAAVASGSFEPFVMTYQEIRKAKYPINHYKNTDLYAYISYIHFHHYQKTKNDRSLIDAFLHAALYCNAKDLSQSSLPPIILEGMSVQTMEEMVNLIRKTRTIDSNTIRKIEFLQKKLREQDFETSNKAIIDLDRSLRLFPFSVPPSDQEWGEREIDEALHKQHWFSALTLLNQSQDRLRQTDVNQIPDYIEKELSLEKKRAIVCERVNDLLLDPKVEDSEKMRYFRLYHGLKGNSLTLKAYEQMQFLFEREGERLMAYWCCQKSIELYYASEHSKMEASIDLSLKAQYSLAIVQLIEKSKLYPPALKERMRANLYSFGDLWRIYLGKEKYNKDLGSFYEELSLHQIERREVYIPQTDEEEEQLRASLELLDICDRHQIYKMLGEHYFLEKKYDKSNYYWEKALFIKADDATLQRLVTTRGPDFLSLFSKIQRSYPLVAFLQSETYSLIAMRYEQRFSRSGDWHDIAYAYVYSAIALMAHHNSSSGPNPKGKEAYYVQFLRIHKLLQPTLNIIKEKIKELPDLFLKLRKGTSKVQDEDSTDVLFAIKEIGRLLEDVNLPKNRARFQAIIKEVDQRMTSGSNTHALKLLSYLENNFEGAYPQRVISEKRALISLHYSKKIASIDSSEQMVDLYQELRECKGVALDPLSHISLMKAYFHTGDLAGSLLQGMKSFQRIVSSGDRAQHLSSILTIVSFLQNLETDPAFKEIFPSLQEHLKGVIAHFTADRVLSISKEELETAVQALEDAINVSRYQMDLKEIRQRIKAHEEIVSQSESDGYYSSIVKLAEYHYILKNYTKAFDYFEKALEIQMDETHMRNYCDCVLKAERFSEYLEFYEKLKAKSHSVSLFQHPFIYLVTGLSFDFRHKHSGDWQDLASYYLNIALAHVFSFSDQNEVAKKDFATDLKEAYGRLNQQELLVHKNALDALHQACLSNDVFDLSLVGTIVALDRSIYLGQPLSDELKVNPTLMPKKSSAVVEQAPLELKERANTAQQVEQDIKTRLKIVDRELSKENYGEALGAMNGVVKLLKEVQLPRHRELKIRERIKEKKQKFSKAYSNYILKQNHAASVNPKHFKDLVEVYDDYSRQDPEDLELAAHQVLMAAYHHVKRDVDSLWHAVKVMQLHMKKAKNQREIVALATSLAPFIENLSRERSDIKEIGAQLSYHKIVSILMGTPGSKFDFDAHLKTLSSYISLYKQTAQSMLRGNQCMKSGAFDQAFHHFKHAYTLQADEETLLELCRSGYSWDKGKELLSFYETINPSLCRYRSGVIYYLLGLSLLQRSHTEKRVEDAVRAYTYLARACIDKEMSQKDQESCLAQFILIFNEIQCIFKKIDFPSKPALVDKMERIFSVTTESLLEEGPFLKLIDECEQFTRMCSSEIENAHSKGEIDPPIESCLNMIRLWSVHLEHAISNNEGKEAKEALEKLKSYLKEYEQLAPGNLLESYDLARKEEAVLKLCAQGEHPLPEIVEDEFSIQMKKGRQAWVEKRYREAFNDFKQAVMIKVSDEPMDKMCHLNTPVPAQNDLLDFFLQIVEKEGNIQCFRRSTIYLRIGHAFYLRNERTDQPEDLCWSYLCLAVAMNLLRHTPQNNLNESLEQDIEIALKRSYKKLQDPSFEWIHQKLDALRVGISQKLNLEKMNELIAEYYFETKTAFAVL